MEYIVMITYKLVRCRRGLDYPLIVETDRSMPLGTWLDAQIGELLDPTHVRSPVLGRLALRPGWLSCTGPFRDWIGKPGEDGRLLQRPDTVWIECEVEGEEQIVTDRRGLRSLPHGWYRYRTRPGQPFPWIISDRIRLVSPLEQAEVESICTAHGVKAQTVATEP